MRGKLMQALWFVFGLEPKQDTSSGLSSPFMGRMRGRMRGMRSCLPRVVVGSCVRCELHTHRDTDMLRYGRPCIIVLETNYYCVRRPIFVWGILKTIFQSCPCLCPRAASLEVGLIYSRIFFCGSGKGRLFPTASGSCLSGSVFGRRVFIWRITTPSRHHNSGRATHLRHLVRRSTHLSSAVRWSVRMQQSRHWKTPSILFLSSFRDKRPRRAVSSRATQPKRDKAEVPLCVSFA